MELRLKSKDKLDKEGSSKELGSETESSLVDVKEEKLLWLSDDKLEVEDKLESKDKEYAFRDSFFFF